MNISLIAYSKLLFRDSDALITDSHQSILFILTWAFRISVSWVFGNLVHSKAPHNTIQII